MFNTGYSIGSFIGPFHAGETKFHAGWNTMALSIACVSRDFCDLVFLCWRKFVTAQEDFVIAKDFDSEISDGLAKLFRYIL